MQFLTKAQLHEAARLATQHRFNRQLEALIKRLPERRFPILRSFDHEHRAMVPCEKHRRLLVLVSKSASRRRSFDTVVIDVPLAYWESLDGEQTQR